MKKIITLILILSTFTVFSQKKIDQTELLKSLTIWKKESNKMSGTFWIPNSYWRIALEGNASVPKESIDLIEKTFKDYLILCAIDLKIENGTNMTFKPKDEIEKSLTIINSNNVYKPLSEKEINYEAKNLFRNISPMFSQMFGEMGKGMHFFVFNIKNNKGKNIINEFEKGELIVNHSGSTFEWALPLSALIDDKLCPFDNKKMNGNWNFCPFHGNKLKSR